MNSEDEGDHREPQPFYEHFMAHVFFWFYISDIAAKRWGGDSTFLFTLLILLLAFISAPALGERYQTSLGRRNLSIIKRKSIATAHTEKAPPQRNLSFLKLLRVITLKKLRSFSYENIALFIVNKTIYNKIYGYDHFTWPRYWDQQAKEKFKEDYYLFITRFFMENSDKSFQALFGKDGVLYIQKTAGGGDNTLGDPEAVDKKSYWWLLICSWRPLLWYKFPKIAARFLQ